MRTRVQNGIQSTSTKLALTLFAAALAVQTGGELQAQADSPWTPPSHSYSIQASTPQGIPQKSGTPAKITGSISLVGQLMWMLGVDDSHNTCTGNSKAAGCQQQTLINQLASDGLSLQATFPDPTNDVTSQLSLSGNQSAIQFSFTTPILKSTDLNTLTLQLIHTNANLQALEVIQAKLLVRVAALNSLLSQLASQGKYSKSDLQFLTTLLACMNAISARITQQIQASTSVVAEIVYPLQVDNVVAQTGSSSSVLGHFRVGISSTLGSGIEGESTSFQTIITHLGDWDDSEIGLWADWGWTDLPGDKYVAQYYWNGKLLSQSTAQTLPIGSSMTQSFSSGELEPGNSNSFEAKLNSSGMMFFLTSTLSDLTYHLPVATDTVAPTWLTGSTPDASHPYVQTSTTRFRTRSRRFWTR